MKIVFITKVTKPTRTIVGPTGQLKTKARVRPSNPIHKLNKTTSGEKTLRGAYKSVGIVMSADIINPPTAKRPDKTETVRRIGNILFNNFTLNPAISANSTSTRQASQCFLREIIANKTKINAAKITKMSILLRIQKQQKICLIIVMDPHPHTFMSFGTCLH